MGIREKEKKKKHKTLNDESSTVPITHLPGFHSPGDLCIQTL